MQPFTLTHPTMKMVNTNLSRLHMSRSLCLTLLTLGLLTPTVSTMAQEVMTLSDLFTLADRHSQELNLKRTEIEVPTKGIEVARVQMENARRDDERCAELLRQHSVTQQQYDSQHTAYLAAQARYE